MQRRTFLELGGLTIAGLGARNVLAGNDPLPLRLKPITLTIGLAKPVKFLHISDSHICHADARDNERKQNLAKKRFGYFKNGPAYLAKMFAYAKAHRETILHTGDLGDFVSAANLEMIRDTFKGVDCIAAVGNHEFSQYVGEAKEDAAYKAVNFDRVKAVWPNDPFFYSRVIGGVNFIAFDDVYRYTEPKQLDLLKAEVAKGLPIILLCHVPFFSEALYQASVPRQATGDFLPADPPGTTGEFVQYFESQPLVKAVLCGHMHWEWDGILPGAGAHQYVAGLAANGYAQEITIV